MAVAVFPSRVCSSTEEDYEKLPASTVPEMQRTNLAPVILQLKALGIDNVLRFSFLSVSVHGSQMWSWGHPASGPSNSTAPGRLLMIFQHSLQPLGRVLMVAYVLQPPPAQSMVQALELLYALGGKNPYRFLIFFIKIVAL